jgi:hypothetical protein
MVVEQLVRAMFLLVIYVLVAKSAQDMWHLYPEAVPACLSMVGPLLVWATGYQDALGWPLAVAMLS